MLVCARLSGLLAVKNHAGWLGVMTVGLCVAICASAGGLKLHWCWSNEIPWRLIARIYPQPIIDLYIGVVEVSLAILLCIPVTRILAMINTFFLGLSFAIYVFFHEGQQCHCFGYASPWIGTPIRWVIILCLILAPLANLIGIRRSNLVSDSRRSDVDEEMRVSPG